jgi:hypothetical protein
MLEAEAGLAIAEPLDLEADRGADPFAQISEARGFRVLRIDAMPLDQCRRSKIRESAGGWV